MMLTDLAKVLRAGRLDVVECPGWTHRGHGPMTDVQGVTVHHTASGRGTGTTLGLGTVRDGRAGLQGPLAQLYLNREGTFFVVAAGLAYHAGVSREPGQTNAHRIGIEALAAGDGWAKDWPQPQMVALIRGCRVLSDHYRFPVADVLGHKETCSPPGRKIDPSFDMDSFRAAVRQVVRESTTEDEMQLNDKITYTPSAAVRMGQEEETVENVLQWPPSVRMARDEIAAARSEIAAARAQLQTIPNRDELATIAARISALEASITELIAVFRAARPE